MLSLQCGKNRVFLRVIALVMVQVFLVTNIGYAAPSDRSFFKNKKVDYKKIQGQREEALQQKKDTLSGKQKAIGSIYNKDKRDLTHRVKISSLKDLSSIYIPDSLGRVVEVYQATSDPSTSLASVPSAKTASTSARGRAGKRQATRPLVVHIQDLHTNPEAQFNEAGILEILIKDYGLGLVCSEGAEGEVDTSSVSGFPDPEVREKTARLFVDSGELTAEEYLSITKYPDLPIWGIEDKDIYFQNIIEFNKIMKFSPDAQVFIQQVKGTLEGMKPEIYSKKLLEIDAKQTEYEEGELDTNEYIDYLFKLLPSPHWGEGKGEGKSGASRYKNIDLLRETLEFEKGIDQKKIIEESQGLLVNLQEILSEKGSKYETEILLAKASLFKDQKISPFSFYSYLEELARRHLKDDLKRYQGLLDFVAYLEKVNSLDSMKLFQEIEELTYETKDILSTNENQKLLTRSLRHIKFLESFFNLKVSNEELDYYLANKDGFKVNWFKSAVTNLTNSTYYIDYNPDLIDMRLPELEHFYEIARERDIAMIDNAVSEIEKRNIKVSALIAGGFHTRGITQLLKEKGYSYVVISPYSSTDIDEENYRFLLSGERKPISELIRELNNQLRTMLLWTNEETIDAYNRDCVPTLARILQTDKDGLMLPYGTERMIPLLVSQVLALHKASGPARIYAMFQGWPLEKLFLPGTDLQILMSESKESLVFRYKEEGLYRYLRADAKGSIDFVSEDEFEGVRILNSSKAKRSLEGAAARRLLEKTTNEPGRGYHRGLAMSNYTKEKETDTRYLATDRMTSLDLEYPVALRDTQLPLKDLPESFSQIQDIDVNFTEDEVVFLVSRVHSGDEGIVMLGFLDDGRPVAVKSYYTQEASEKAKDEYLLEDFQGAIRADQLGIGPRFHGKYIDAKGKVNLVMDIVPGDFLPASKGSITKDTIRDFREINKRLARIEKKISMASDFQYYVTPEGRIQVIDQRSLVSGQQVEFDLEKQGIPPYIIESSYLYALVQLLNFAKRAVIEAALEDMRDNEPGTFSDLKTYLEKYRPYIDFVGVREAFSRLAQTPSHKELAGRPLAGPVSNYVKWIDDILGQAGQILTDGELLDMAEDLGIRRDMAERIYKETGQMSDGAYGFSKSLPDDGKQNVYLMRDAFSLYCAEKISGQTPKALYISKSTFREFLEMNQLADVVIHFMFREIKDVMGLPRDASIPEERFEEFKAYFFNMLEALILDKELEEERFEQFLEYKDNFKQASVKLLSYLEAIGITEGDMEQKGIRFIDTTRVGSLALFMEGLVRIRLKETGSEEVSINEKVDTRMFFSDLSPAISYSDSLDAARAVESTYWPIEFNQREGLDQNSVPIVSEIEVDKNKFLYRAIVLRNRLLILRDIDRTAAKGSPLDLARYLAAHKHYRNNPISIADIRKIRINPETGRSYMDSTIYLEINSLKEIGILESAGRGMYALSEEFALDQIAFIHEEIKGIIEARDSEGRTLGLDRYRLDDLEEEKIGAIRKAVMHVIGNIKEIRKKVARGELFYLGDNIISLKQLRPLARALEISLDYIDDNALGPEEREQKALFKQGLIIDAGGYGLKHPEERCLDIAIRDENGREVASITIWPLKRADGISFDKKRVFSEYFGIEPRWMTGKGICGPVLYKALLNLLYDLDYREIYGHPGQGYEKFWKRMGQKPTEEKIYKPDDSYGFYIEKPDAIKGHCPVVTVLYKGLISEPARLASNQNIENIFYASWAHVKEHSPENFHETDMIMSDGRTVDRSLIDSIRGHEKARDAAGGETVEIQGYEFNVWEIQNQKVLVSKDVVDAISDGELGALLENALSETGFKETQDRLPLVIASLSKSPRLFEDCQENSFIGINQAFLKLYSVYKELSVTYKGAPFEKECLKILAYLGIFLQAGLEHELRHEMGDDSEDRLVHLDVARIKVLCTAANIDLAHLVSFFKGTGIIDRDFANEVVPELEDKGLGLMARVGKDILELRREWKVNPKSFTYLLNVPVSRNNKDAVRLIIQLMKEDPRCYIGFGDMSKIGVMNNAFTRKIVDDLIPVMVAAGDIILAKYKGSCVRKGGDEIGLVLPSDLTPEKVNDIRLELQAALASFISDMYGFAKLSGVTEENMESINNALKTDALAGVYRDADGFFMVFDRTLSSTGNLEEDSIMAVNRVNSILAEGEIKAALSPVEIVSPRLNLGIVKASADSDDIHANYGKSIRHAEYVLDKSRKDGMHGATSETIGGLDRFFEDMERPTIPELGKERRQEIAKRLTDSGIKLYYDQIEEYYPVVKREYLGYVIRQMSSAPIGTAVLVRGPPDNFYEVRRTDYNNIRIMKLELVYEPYGDLKEDVDEAIRRGEFTAEDLRQRWPGGYGFKVVNQFSGHEEANKVILLEAELLNNMDIFFEGAGVFEDVVDNISSVLSSNIENELGIQAKIKPVLSMMSLGVHASPEGAITIIDDLGKIDRGIESIYRTPQGNIIKIFYESRMEEFEEAGRGQRVKERKKFTRILRDAYKGPPLNEKDFATLSLDGMRLASNASVGDWQAVPLVGVQPLKDVKDNVFVVGDIHGKLDGFRETLEGIGLIKKGSRDDGLEDRWIASTGTTLVQGSGIMRSMEMYVYLGHLRSKAEEKNCRIIRIVYTPRHSNKLLYWLKHTGGKWLQALEEGKEIECLDKVYEDDELRKLIYGEKRGAIVFKNGEAMAAYPLVKDSDTDWPIPEITPIEMSIQRASRDLMSVEVGKPFPIGPATTLRSQKEESVKQINWGKLIDSKQRSSQALGQMIDEAQPADLEIESFIVDQIVKILGIEAEGQERKLLIDLVGDEKQETRETHIEEFRKFHGYIIKEIVDLVEESRSTLEENKGAFDAAEIKRINKVFERIEMLIKAPSGKAEGMIVSSDREELPADLLNRIEETCEAIASAVRKRQRHDDEILESLFIEKCEPYPEGNNVYNACIETLEHYITNPLQIIKGYVQYISGREGEKPGPEELEVILRNNKRLIDFVQSIENFTKEELMEVIVSGSRVEGMQDITKDRLDKKLAAAKELIDRRIKEIKPLVNRLNNMILRLAGKEYEDSRANSRARPKTTPLDNKVKRNPSMHSL